MLKIDGFEVRETIYSPYYLVSENGSVYSCFDGNIRKLYLGDWKQKNRKKEKTGVIYKIVTISVNGKLMTRPVHRLVAQSFIPNPNNYRCVNHIDGNTLNNNVENLEWCTNSYNTRHAFSNGLINVYREGKKCKICGHKIIDRNKTGYCQFCGVKYFHTSSNISKYIDVEEHEKFLNELNRILEEKDISYEELAEMTGYAIRTIKNYMRFMSTSKNVKRKILEVLDIKDGAIRPTTDNPA